jgi:alkylation response protein AidB-like acyl-CoA dehydrogenase
MSDIPEKEIDELLARVRELADGKIEEVQDEDDEDDEEELDDYQLYLEGFLSRHYPEEEYDDWTWWCPGREL